MNNHRSPRWFTALAVRAALGAVLGAALIATASPAAADTELRRFAVIIGANDGGPDRAVLRYAASDARSVADVVGELGGITAPDIALLIDPSHSDIRAGFDEMRARIERAKRGPNGQSSRVELVVYYSGHSDEEGLLLAGEHLPYSELRDHIRSVPADVHIAILDSCASGAFTRTKGGQRRPAFLVDQANQVRGHAFLSSSSADEAAQESDRIQASFFTHFLISGLRGGADSNRDDRVTLSEAYQFAFRETVARTERTAHGAQHPAYDMHLAGTGDVVMTDLRATSAALVLAKDISGRLFIRNRAGQLVIELEKIAGTPVVLGLSPERYQITVERGPKRFQADIELAKGRRTTLARAALRELAAEVNVARGGALPGQTGPDGQMSAHTDGDDSMTPASLSIVPPLSTSNASASTYAALNVIAGVGMNLRGVEIGGVINGRRGDVTGVQVAGVGSWTNGDVRALQAAGVGHLTGGDVRGLQSGGVGNWTSGDVTGVQNAGVGNWTGGDVTGVQLAGVANVNNGDVTGIQLAGVGNWSRGSWNGIRAAGVANVSGGDEETRGIALAGVANVQPGAHAGLQLAGVGNVQRQRFRGLQASGVFNLVADDVRGVQLSVLNIGGDVTGVQAGVINIARHVRGTQIGLVNIADSYDGAPIGLIPIVGDGHRAFEAWTSDLAPVHVGFKFGSKRVYTQLSAGLTGDNYLYGVALGVHSPIGEYYLDIDVGAYDTVSRDDPKSEDAFIARARAAVGAPLGQGLSIFAGVTMSSLFDFETERAEALDLSWFDGQRYERDKVTIQVFPGLFAGIAY